MGDPLIWVLGGCLMLGALGAALLDRWRRRTGRGAWPILLWGIAPFIVIGVPAFSCAMFANEAAARDGACMALGGAMMALPIFYWPVWLAGLVIGLLLHRLAAPR